MRLSRSCGSTVALRPWSMREVIYQTTILDGIAYSHIVDPKTGLGLVDSCEVTVVAADGTAADALASAFSVLGPDKSVGIAAQIPGLRVRFRDTEGRTRWLAADDVRKNELRRK